MKHDLRDDDRACGGSDAEEFARRVRCLAIRAHEVLDRLDCSLHEVVELQYGVNHLLGEPKVPRSSELHRWLLAAAEAIEVKLRCWSLEDLESVVA